jgi:hypothetical protein
LIGGGHLTTVEIVAAIPAFATVCQPSERDPDYLVCQKTPSEWMWHIRRIGKATSADALELTLKSIRFIFHRNSLIRLFRF